MCSYRISMGFEEGKYSAIPNISLADVAFTECKRTIIALLKKAGMGVLL